MLKKLMQTLLCFVLVLSLCLPSGVMAATSAAPIVSDITASGSEASVTVTNPWFGDTQKIVFIATSNSASSSNIMGMLDSASAPSVASKPGNGDNSPVTLKADISGFSGNIRYFVMAEDSSGRRSSLYNSAPMPVSKIDADANFKYTELTWPAAQDDFDAVAYYEIKRYKGEDTSVIDTEFGTNGVVQTSQCRYIDKFSPDMSVELEDVTYTYTVAVVDHEGLRSDNTADGGKVMSATVTTPVAAYVTLYPDEETTKENSHNMTFYFLEQGAGGTTNTNQSKGVSLYPAEGSDRRPCRRTINTEAKTNSYFYFRVNTALFGENDNEVTMTITYYDDGITPVNLDYFPSDVTGTSYESVRFPGGIPSSGRAGWREASIGLTNFSSTKIKSSWTTGQFRFFTGKNPNDIYLSKVKVQKTADIGTLADPNAPDDPANGRYIDFDLADSNCMKFASKEYDDKAPNDQQSKLGEYEGLMCRQTITFNNNGTKQSNLYFEVDPTDFDNSKKTKLIINYYDDGKIKKACYKVPKPGSTTEFNNRYPDILPLSAGVVTGWREAEIELTDFSVDRTWSINNMNPQLRLYSADADAILYISRLEIVQEDNGSTGGGTGGGEEPPSEEPPVYTFISPDSGDENIALIMCGDSIMQTYESKYYPQAGIGQVIGRYFNSSNVTVNNLGEGGRSSKSFWDSNVLQNAVIEKGDYVFIKFGHNDVHTDTRHTDPAGDENTEGSYKYYLKKMVDYVKSKEANPVLVTSIVKRYYSGDTWQEYRADGSARQDHLPYVEAMRAFGKANNIPVIDAYNKTKETLQTLTNDESKEYYLYFTKEDFETDSGFGADTLYSSVTDAEYESASSKAYLVSPSHAKDDMTHINFKGANLIAELIRDKVKELNMPLAVYTLDTPVDPEIPNPPAVRDAESSWIAFLDKQEGDETVVYAVSDGMTFRDAVYDGTNTTDSSQTIPTVYNGRASRRTVNKEFGAQTFMYFGVDTNIFTAEDKEVVLTFDYYDDGVSTVKMTYFRDTGNQYTFDFATSGKAGWRTVSKEISDFSTAVSSGWQPLGHFRFTTPYDATNTAEVYISDVKMQRKEDLTKLDKTQGAWIAFSGENGEAVSNGISYIGPDYNPSSANENQTLASADYNGRPCRSTTSKEQNRRTYFYVDIDDEVITESENDVVIVIDYYDDGVAPIRLDYFKPTGDPSTSAGRSYAEVKSTGVAGWRRIAIEKSDFSTTNKASGWTLGQLRMDSKYGTTSGLNGATVTENLNLYSVKILSKTAITTGASAPVVMPE